MNGIDFESSLSGWFEEFCDLKQAGGADFRAQAFILRRFDRHLSSHHREPAEVDPTVLGDYLAGHAHLAPRTRANIVTVVWPALEYACRHGAPCPPTPLRPVFPRVPTRTPVILTEEEVERLLLAARQLPQKGSLHPQTYATLFGLLAVTGIRIGEAQKLEIRDLDLQRRQFLVREGKFKKSRLLPIHESTAIALDRYLEQRRRARMPGGGESPVFVNLRGNPLVYENVRQIFHRLCRSTGIATGSRHPRIHDLRHSFAVRRVIAWYRAGIDVNTRLLALSTYLGHVSIDNTLVYLRPNEEMLDQASRRFEAISAPRFARDGEEVGT